MPCRPQNALTGEEIHTNHVLNIVKLTEAVKQFLNFFHLTGTSRNKPGNRHGAKECKDSSIKYQKSKIAFGYPQPS